MNYGTVIDNTLHPAPRAFMLHGAMVTNPKAEHFAALNEERATHGLPPYLPVVDERPSADATHYAVAIALVVRPETTRTNLTFFVVKTETDGVIDTQYLWCNWNIVLPPNRFVVYQGFGQCTTNKMKFAQWTNTVTVTQNGRTWNGCHVGTVTRPTWAQNQSCLDLPNDRLGGPDGFDFGDLTLTVGGTVPYTGFVTNGLTGEVLYFNNGFNMGNPEDEQ